MRKILAWVLVALGAFLVVAAVVAQTWAPAQVERTPLDTDNTTYLSGSAMKANPANDYELEPLDVVAFSTNRADADVSDDDVIAWVSTLCLVVDEGDPTGCVDEDDPQGRLISAETDVFATDRHTGMTVNDDEYLPADATPQEGLQNKWPFGAEKKTYPSGTDWPGTRSTPPTRARRTSTASGRSSSSTWSSPTPRCGRTSTTPGTTCRRSV